MNREERVALAGLSQVHAALEADELTAEIRRDMRKIVGGLVPVAEQLQPGQAIGPGQFDAALMAKQVHRLNAAVTVEVEGPRERKAAAEGDLVLGDRARFPSPADQPRAAARLAGMDVADQNAVRAAVGVLAMTRQVLGDAAPVPAAEQQALASMSRHAAALERGFLHMVSRPEVGDEQVVAAARTLNELGATILRPRPVGPTGPAEPTVADQRLAALTTAGAAMTRAYTTTVHSGRTAERIGRELRACEHATMDLAAPPAVKTGLDRLGRVSPELRRMVDGARARLGAAAAGEPDRVTAARRDLDASLAELGGPADRTRGGWLREQAPRFRAIEHAARQAQKATQQPSSLVERVTDKIRHEVARRDVVVKRRGADRDLDNVPAREMSAVERAQATVKGMAKGTSQHVTSAVDRVRAARRNVAGAQAPQPPGMPPPAVVNQPGPQAGPTAAGRR